MTATDLVISLLRYPCDNLTQHEKTFLEMITFSYLYQQLLTTFQETFGNHREEFMIDGVLIQNLVNDLIASSDYSIPALASYTGYPEDVIYDLASGMNLQPTLSLSTKIIELHALSRREFYSSLIRKILDKIKLDS